MQKDLTEFNETLIDVNNLPESMYFTGKPCKYGHISPRYKSSCRCVVCVKISRIKDRDKNIARIAKWREKNRDKISEYRVKNKDRDNASARERERNRRKTHPEKVLEWTNRWRKKNMDKVLSYNQKRRAMKLSAPGEYTGDDIKKLYSIQVGRCAACGKKLEKYHVDHIIPLTKGGTNFPNNLQLLCPRCNTSKSDKMPEIFYRELGFLL